MKLFPKTPIPSNHPFINNKYTQWYYDIIHNARNRSVQGYVESHHIIPDCFFKNRSRKGQPGWLLGDPNDPSNIVLLTAEEHLVVHQLLTRMLLDKPSFVKMVYALNWLISTPNNQGKISKRLYAESKKLLSEAKTGVPRSLETRLKISQRNRDRGSPTPESNRKRSETLKGRKHDPEVIARRAASLKGRVVSEQTRQILRELNTGERNARWGKKHTAETRAKISAKRRGQKSSAPNHWLGRSHSLESKLKMSASQTGRTHSEETKRKMSESQKRRRASSI